MGSKFVGSSFSLSEVRQALERHSWLSWPTHRTLRFRALALIGAPTPSTFSARMEDCVECSQLATHYLLYGAARLIQAISGHGIATGL